MPTYEYECRACGHHFDVMQKFSDAPLTDCPECDKKNGLQKLISLNGFQLKGTGWYVTDYKSTPSDSSTKSSEGSGGKGD